MIRTLRTLACTIFFGTMLHAQVITPTQVDSIPMMDGEKLPADVYLPPGWTSGPVILIQTPYNRQGFQLTGLPLGFYNSLNGSNYAFVITDWRGFWGGAQAWHSNPPSHGQDGYSTVEWIAAQSWSNGKIGTWGPSALGNVQFQTAKEYPPHLTCICPLVAGPQTLYQEYYPNGCLRTEYLEQLDGLGFGTSAFVLPYPTYNFAWSVFAEPPTFYPDSIPVPCYMIGGWYDHNIEKMMSFFPALRTQSPANVQNEHRLLMGPWTHGGHGTSYVGSSTQGQLSYPQAQGWSDSLALDFFDYHLRGVSNNWNNSPYIQYFTMGSNQWHNTASWPPAGFSPVTLYFEPNQTLDVAIPTSTTSSFSYNYDPNDPSPTVGGPTLRLDQFQGPYDQADSVEVRNDILLFTTAPLAQDFTMTGNATVHLEVSSDRTDTDFDVRLCDVYPTGQSMIVNDGVYRMRFRNGFTPSDTAAMVPGTHYNVDIVLPNTSITFLAGHRIRVDVSSSNYPRFNRNMNTDGPMYPGPSMDTLVNPLVANNTVYTNSIYSSKITMPATTWPNGIAEQTTEANWSIYPDPASDHFNVVFSDNGMHHVRVLDIHGRVIAEKDVTATSVSFSTEEMSDDCYFVEISDGTSRSVRKIIVVH